MTRGRWLRWLEAAFLAMGVALATWCVLVLVEAYYTQSLPVPPPTPVEPARSLPGEASPGAPPPPITAAPGSWVARLEVPTLNLATTVLEGSDARTLLKAAGHIEDTPLPGQPGNVGIAGHRDTVFRPLSRAQVGTPMTLVTRDRTFYYTISRTLIVKPEDVYVLDPTARPTLTLVTCYPFEFIGHAPKRFVVQAELVREEPRIAQH